MVLEPVLRTAIEIDRRHLPAALAPGVLALLVTDLSERSVLPHHSDLRAIADAVRRIPAHRFDDYIAAVVARGPVARVSASSGGQ